MFLGLGLLQVPELLYSAHKKLQETKQRKARDVLEAMVGRRQENGTAHLQHHTQCKNHVDANDAANAHKKTDCEIKRTHEGECDIWLTQNEVQRQSVINRIDILEAKLEQVLVENRALVQYISKSENIDRKRIQDEILL